jgi:hypothetical protein
MTDWRFDTAEELMTAATDLLATKADIEETVADLDVAEDLALQATYETGTDLSDTARTADEALAAAEALRDATEAEADGAGPLGAVGLLFAGTEDDLADAARAFEVGDYGTVETLADEVESTMDGAALAGVVRLLGVLIVGLVVAGGWILLRRRRARRGSAAAEAGATEAPVLGPPAPGPEAALLQADGAQGVGGPPDGGGEGGV